jgi:hypothetical protein
MTRPDTFEQGITRNFLRRREIIHLSRFLTGHALGEEPKKAEHIFMEDTISSRYHREESLGGYLLRIRKAMISDFP